jgi:predicted phage terminase large subunit-like protein
MVTATDYLELGLEPPPEPEHDPNNPFHQTAAMWEAQHQPKKRRFATPGELAKYLKPKTVQTPALDLIDEALTNLGPDDRLIITMPPQEGKTERVSRDFPLWTLLDDPDCRIFMASYGSSLSVRNGKAIRRAIEGHPDLGLRLAPDAGAANEWEIDGREGGVYSVGIGGAGSGKPADLIIIDDPIRNRKEADSETYRQTNWDWWTDVAAARSASRVVLVLTRWHDDDLAGRLLAEPDSTWKVLNIPAQADHDPSKGETDILGREPGEFMKSARSNRNWPQRKREAGKRGWQALYQGNPSPSGGLVFNTGDVHWWTRFPARASGAEICPECGVPRTIFVGEVEFAGMRQMESWDLTFTGTATSDWVVGQRWGASGSRRFLMSQRRGKWEFTDQIVQMKAQAEEDGDRVTQRLVEKAANGAAALSTLRGQVGGLRPIKPTESKEARAIAVTPQFESHDVYLPHPEDPGNEWVLDGEDDSDGLLEELRLFPTGKHDDQVDALTQYLNHARVVGNGEAAKVSAKGMERQVWQKA